MHINNKLHKMCNIKFHENQVIRDMFRSELKHFLFLEKDEKSIKNYKILYNRDTNLIKRTQGFLQNVRQIALSLQARILKQLLRLTLIQLM